MKELETNVLVVGAGPVGLSLAGDLGWRGHSCFLIEQGDGVVRQAKMDGVGVRTMEFCRRWGIVKDVEGSEYNRAYPQDNVYLTTLDGYELGRQPMPAMKDDAPPAESPQKRERCPQNMFDPILQKFARSQSGVDIQYGRRLVDFVEGKEDVVATVLDTATQEQMKVRAKYLVGCDGGRSTVREKLGIAMQGKGLLTHTTNAIFRCANFNQLHNKVPGYRYMFVGGNGVWGTIVAINGNDQWRMSIIGNANERVEYSDDQLKEFAYKAVGRKFDMEILSTLRWTRVEAVADSYGRGRVYLAGDAVHLTSPTGGLGMNTGIGDAVDLSWKLSACLEGWGGPKLLDSYEVERRPVAHRITKFSTSNLEVMQKVPHTAKVLDAGLEGDEARARVGKALADGLRKEWFSKNMHLGNRYVSSPVCIYGEPETQAAIDADYLDPVNYVQSTRVGARAPHVWLKDGRSTLDLFGRGFVLMCHAEDLIPAQRILDAAEAAGVPISVYPMYDAPLIKAFERRLVLVRPDGHVAWRADSVPSDAATLISTIAGSALAEAVA